jgi:hypothetical protein
LVSAYYNASSNSFVYGVVNEGDDIKNATIEIQEFRLSTHTAHPEWTYHHEVPVIPAGTSGEFPAYKKSWYCEKLSNCMVRIQLKSKNGDILAEDSVLPMGYLVVKSSW